LGNPERFNTDALFQTVSCCLWLTRKRVRRLSAGHMVCHMLRRHLSDLFQLVCRLHSFAVLLRRSGLQRIVHLCDRCALSEYAPVAPPLCACAGNISRVGLMRGLSELKNRSCDSNLIMLCISRFPTMNLFWKFVFDVLSARCLRQKVIHPSL